MEGSKLNSGAGFKSVAFAWRTSNNQLAKKNGLILID